MKVVSFVNFKGGVGKSMLVANLAAVGVKKEQKVLIADCNQELPTQALMFGCESVLPRSNVLSEASETLKIWSLGPSLGEFELPQLWDLADLVLVDTGHNPSTAFDNVIAQSDLIVLTTNPTAQSLLGAYQCAREVVTKKPGARLAFIMNQCNGSTSAKIASKRLISTCIRILNTEIVQLGTIEYDKKLDTSMANQEVLAAKQQVKSIDAVLESILTFEPATIASTGILHELRPNPNQSQNLAA